MLGSRTWQLPVGAVVLLRVAASILRRQPKGGASRLPGDHRRTRVSREFCQLSFSSKQWIHRRGQVLKYCEYEFLEGGLHAGRDSAGIPRSEGVRQLSQV